MTPEMVMTIGKETAIALLMIASPMLILAVVVGVSVTIFQTVTNLKDQTLTFVPKIVAIVLALIFFMPFILQTLTSFTIKIFTLAQTIAS
ncbi:MAG: flagellar type III secretion system protein FliQ [Candidatus Aureabacteria bacterium]|nr:flagellar type III secretion system protein FliQ [Candidatus Auribacterota bacterium]